MKLGNNKPFIGLLAIAIGIAFSLQSSTTSISAKSGAKAGKDVRFKVRIENISDKDGQVASDGAKWPFALSPGMWVTHEREVRLFREGNVAEPALEMQAEDGNPGGLVARLDARGHDGMQHGIFNTPTGTKAPGPIGPGGAYEFTFAAKPGMKLSVITMFGQSNDWFYAPERQGIELFRNGKPVSGDITSEFMLFDAGTEADEEPGIGPNQAPRQKAPNTGTAESGKVKIAKDSVFFSRTGQLFRVTITPQDAMARS